MKWRLYLEAALYSWEHTAKIRRFGHVLTSGNTQLQSKGGAWVERAGGRGVTQEVRVFK